MWRLALILNYLMLNLLITSNNHKVWNTELRHLWKIKKPKKINHPQFARLNSYQAVCTWGEDSWLRTMEIANKTLQGFSLNEFP